MQILSQKSEALKISIPKPNLPEDHPTHIPTTATTRTQILDITANLIPDRMGDRLQQVQAQVRVDPPLAQEDLSKGRERMMVEVLVQAQALASRALVPEEVQMMAKETLAQVLEIREVYKMITYFVFLTWIMYCESTFHQI